MTALQAESRLLNRYDILCLGTFWALSNSELDFLALSQRFVSIACNSAEMGKHVGARFLLDKAKAFGIIKPFNSSGSRHSHNPNYSKVMGAFL
jgi:hypothetical protein